MSSKSKLRRSPATPEKPKEEYVAEGKFGCLYKNVTSCSDPNVVIKNSIGKYFARERDYQDEVANLKIIHNLDPGYLYTPRVYGSCLTNKPVDAKCSLLMPEQVFKVVSEYGGLSISDYMKSQSFSAAALIELLDKLEPIVIGLQDLHKKGYVHGDIHAGNILYNPATRRMVISDFGGLRKHTGPKAKQDFQSLALGLRELAQIVDMEAVDTKTVETIGDFLQALNKGSFSEIWPAYQTLDAAIKPYVIPGGRLTSRRGYLGRM